MPYRCLLVDADNTILDFAACEGRIFGELTQRYNLPKTCPDGVPIVDAYRRINGALWREYEQNAISPGFLRVERFRRLLDRIGAPGTGVVSAFQLNESFIALLGTCGALVPGAREFLHAYQPVTIVTNGFSSVQRSRILAADIGQFIGELCISEEIGYAKPDPRFFDEVFSRISCPDRSEILVVGDSLSSDIQGGINAGVATCWFDRDGTAKTSEPSEGPVPDYRITRLSELADVIGR